MAVRVGLSRHRAPRDWGSHLREAGGQKTNEGIRIYLRPTETRPWAEAHVGTITPEDTIRATYSPSNFGLEVWGSGRIVDGKRKSARTLPSVLKAVERRSKGGYIVRTEHGSFEVIKPSPNY